MAGSPRSWPKPNNAAQISSTISDNCFEKRASRNCSGVPRSMASFSRPATLPSSVPMPVATTTPRARPWVTVVPLKPRLVRSPSASLSPTRASVRFSTVTDSPVSVDSSTLSCAASSSRRSAGIWLPASSSTMSPGTSAVAGTTCTAPLRSTVACAAASWRSAAMAWSARQACTKPMTALSTTMTRITSVSVTSPTSPEMTAAPSSTSTMKSLNWSASRRHQGRSCDAANSLVPWVVLRRCASSACRPASGLTPWAWATASVGCRCGAVDGDMRRSVKRAARPRISARLAAGLCRTGAGLLAPGSAPGA